MARITVAAPVTMNPDELHRRGSYLLLSASAAARPLRLLGRPSLGGEAARLQSTVPLNLSGNGQRVAFTSMAPLIIVGA